MKRVVQVVVVVLVMATPLSGQLPEPWRQWRYAAVINAPDVAAARLTSVVISAEVTARAQSDWGDLRVIDETGREVPYVLHARFGGTRTERRQARVLEPSFVPGKHAQIIVDAGAGGAIHNSIRLRVDTPQDLITWVEVAVSDDASEWRVVRERGPLFSLKQEGQGERTEVSYPDSRARYLRARILEDPARYKLTGAEIGFETSRPGERVAVELPFAKVEGDPRRSTWRSPSGAAARSISEIRFQTAQPGFYRPVTIESSDDGKQWLQVGAGQISRTTEGGKTQESLAVAFPERRASEWRVSVFNGNDAPVPDLAPVARATPRRVVFRQEPGRRYTLIYGHPRASAPQYDIARLIDETALDSAAEAGLAAIVTNEAYDDPTPWTDRNPFVIWAALGVAVLVLGTLAVRALKGTGGTS
jgi:uncharacterized protein DUF3999